MVVRKTFDVTLSTTTTKLPLWIAYNHLTVLFYVSVNKVCLFVIKYLPQKCHEMSIVRFYHIVLAFQKVELKLPKLVEAVVCQDFVLAIFLLLL